MSKQLTLLCRSREPKPPLQRRVLQPCSSCWRSGQVACRDYETTNVRQGCRRRVEATTGEACRWVAEVVGAERWAGKGEERGRAGVVTRRRKIQSEIRRSADRAVGLRTCRDPEIKRCLVTARGVFPDPGARFPEKIIWQRGQVDAGPPFPLPVPAVHPLLQPTWILGVAVWYPAAAAGEERFDFPGGAGQLVVSRFVISSSVFASV